MVTMILVVITTATITLVIIIIRTVFMMISLGRHSKGEFTQVI